MLLNNKFTPLMLNYFKLLQIITITINEMFINIFFDLNIYCI